MKLLFLYLIAAFILIYLLLITISFAKPKKLGIRDGKLSELSKKPDGVSSQTKYENKSILPLPFKGSVRESKEVVISILDTLADIVITSNTDNYIYAVFTAPNTKFKDDVEFNFSKKEEVIHYRSQSRTGESDPGENRKRYEEIRKLYLSN